MAKKTYKIKQEVKFNNNTTVRTFDYACDEAEIAAFLATLEGVLTVFTEDTTLSSVDGSSPVVTGGLPIDSISMVHSEAKTAFIGAYDKPILFKATTSVPEIQAMLSTHKPFAGAYVDQTPDAVYPKVSHMGHF